MEQKNINCLKLKTLEKIDSVEECKNYLENFKIFTLNFINDNIFKNKN